MSDLKRSPGNWSVTSRMISGEGWAVISDHDFTGALGTTHNRFMAQYIGNPEDAALIAAAPDLYAALDGLLGKIDGFLPSWVHEEFPDQVKDARAALSKARGES